MNQDEKKQYKERYLLKKQQGEKFWPDEIYKDLIVAFAIFIVLVVLATFVGVAGEPKADPSDTTYLPRPEWYFLFLFKFLAIYGMIPVLGKIEPIATTLIPGLAVGLLFLLPFVDRSTGRHYKKRVAALSTMTVIVVTIVCLTLIADVPTSIGNTPGVYIAGVLQVLSGLILPGVAILAIMIIPRLFKDNANPVLIWTTGILSLLTVATAVGTLITAPPKAEVVEAAVFDSLSESIAAGDELYSIHCAECHGSDGDVTTIEGVDGLEGKIISPISAKDIMYTFEDRTLYNIIEQGLPDLGMVPFGRAAGGELGPGEIEAVVNFMRYTWDDRSEMPVEAAQIGKIPELAEGEVPSYEVHMQPLIKRYCISCHRSGKESKSHNYLMTTYDEVLNTGDNAGKNLIPGDLNSLIIRTIHREDIADLEIGAMPPTKQLKPEVIAIFEKWVAGGAPNTAAEAATATLP